MNHCVPDWSMDDDNVSLHDVLHPVNQRISVRPDYELVELLWQNGHVVMQSQTHRKTATPLNEIKQCQRPETMLKCGGIFENSTKTVDVEEATSWLEYPVDDPLDREFCLEFFGLPTEPPTADKIKDATTGEKFGRSGTIEGNNLEHILRQSNGLHFGENMMSPNPQCAPSFPQTSSRDAGNAINFSCNPKPSKRELGSLNGQLGEKTSRNKKQGEVGETPSTMTKEASICGSNQVQGRSNERSRNAVRGPSAKVVKDTAQPGFSSEMAHTDTHETTVTSSSGGFGCSFGRTDLKSVSTTSHKRKERDADEFESQSEDADYEVTEANRPSERSVSARRSRAAEVHNMAERRRRDRINEKMRALQELIPHCNKSDKASMLDEAIEYLKSLQLQLQMMWMGSGMAAMMLPGMQHYMSRMGMGIGHGPMPSVHGPMQFPRVPMVGQSMSLNPAVNQGSICPPPFVSPVNFQNQMQNSHMRESYAHYLGFQHMQPSPQAMNLYGSMLMQQNQGALAANTVAPLDAAAPSANIQNIKTG